MSSNPNPVQGDKPFNTFNRFQLEQQIQRGIQKKNGFRRDPPPIEVPGLARLFIFNVSDKEYRWTQPGFPFYVIPACGRDEQFSKPIYELGHQDEPGIKGIINYEFLEIDKTKWAQHLAEEIAMEIMGIGAGKPPEQNLENFGLFRSWSNPPKASEADAAKKRFLGTLEQIVKDGNKIYAQGEKRSPDGQIIGSEHIWAAGLLGQVEPWAKTAKQMIACPECQFDMPANASVHFGPGGCGAVIDLERALESGLIDQKKYDTISAARKRKKVDETVQ
jgi:hypothetical protein